MAVLQNIQRRALSLWMMVRCLQNKVINQNVSVFIVNLLLLQATVQGKSSLAGGQRNLADLTNTVLTGNDAFVIDRDEVLHIALETT
jgi:hypothetical protein